ncbi:MAG: hypothetical protein JNM75_15505 [Rhodospirillales bacterium]|nr:hypothetical protein [Rhodospirillales bacterium]
MLGLPEAREDAAPSTTVEVESKSMLHLQSSDVQVFRVALYNRKVRALVRERKRHGCFGDRWAEIQSRDVVARDEEEARLLIAERFPPEDGFVVARIAPAYVPGPRWPSACPAAVAAR